MLIAPRFVWWCRVKLRLISAPLQQLGNRCRSCSRLENRRCTWSTTWVVVQTKKQQRVFSTRFNKVPPPRLIPRGDRVTQKLNVCGNVVGNGSRRDFHRAGTNHHTSYLVYLSIFLSVNHHRYLRTVAWFETLFFEQWNMQASLERYFSGFAWYPDHWINLTEKDQLQELSTVLPYSALRAQFFYIDSHTLSVWQVSARCAHLAQNRFCDDSD